MKVFKYLILSLFVFMLSACTAEEFEQSTPVSQQDAPIELAISLDNIAHVNMNSRATENDKLFSQLNHINIRIFFKDADDVRLAYQWNGTTWEQKLSTQGNNYVVDHFTKKDTLYVHLNPKQGNKVDSAEVVANYKEGGNYVVLDSFGKWEDMKNATLAFPTSFNDTDECVLYGLCNTPIFKENAHEGAQGGNKGCYVLNVPLKRPYAMVKVGVNLQGLKEGVTITPKFVQLCNVPKECKIVPNNSPAQDAEMEQYGQKMSAFRVDKTNENVLVVDNLYLFENMQNCHAKACTSSQDISDSKQRGKNPINRNATPEEVYTSFKDTRLFSYVLLEADYEYKTESAHVKGTIRYRFYLGEDIEYGFDVKRNTIYKLTLNLTGVGGIKESGAMTADGVINVSGNTKDSQWRVDTELSDLWIDFGEGTDFNIDGQEVKFTVKTGNDKPETWEIKVSGKETAWIMVRKETNYAPYYTYVTPDYDEYNKISAKGSEDIYVFLKSYASEWATIQKHWNDSKPYREITLYVRKENQPSTEVSYTIKQWYPIKITDDLYVDRIDRYAKEGLPWGAKDYTATSGDSRTILIDYAKKYYKASEYEKDVMNNTINSALNSQGYAERPWASGDGWNFYYYTLPTVDQWKRINKVLTERKDITFNKYSNAPYWTLTTSVSPTGENMSYTFTPGKGQTNGKETSRDEKHRFRLVWNSFGLYY